MVEQDMAGPGEVESMLVGNWGPSGHKKLGGIGNAFSIFAL